MARKGANRTAENLVARPMPAAPIGSAEKMLQRRGTTQPPLSAGNRDFHEGFEEHEEATVEVNLVRPAARPPVIHNRRDDQQEGNHCGRDRYKRRWRAAVCRTGWG